MRKLGLKIAVLMALTLMLVVSTASAGGSGPVVYKAMLSGTNEVPPVSTGAWGEASIWFSPDGNTLFYNVVVHNIQNAHMAHLHIASAGQNGPVVLWLYPASGPPPQEKHGNFDGVLSAGTLTAANLAGPMAGRTLTDLATEMANGRIYVNVHTTQNPGGEIRGQVGAAAVEGPAGNGTVGFDTPFYRNDFLLRWDFNGNGTYEITEVVGVVDAFNVFEDIQFHCQPVSGATSYRVAVVQMLPSVDQSLVSGESGFLPPWTSWPYVYEIKVAHHWAENPNGTNFTLGSLGWGEGVCLVCPSYIVVTPETVTKYLDTATGTYEYEYAALPGAANQVSEPFWLTLP